MFTIAFGHQHLVDVCPCPEYRPAGSTGLTYGFPRLTPMGYGNDAPSALHVES
ncbi:MAG: hypothetical protein ACJ71Q_06225 [Terriglobales bacterium]